MSVTCVSSLNAALARLLKEDERVVLIGEDLLDPYGGAFKVTRGLSTEFPARVLATPISEAGFTAVAAGMAMRGLRPVVEIMFGDFLMLAADQLLNYITKAEWMYNGQVRVPLVIRAPMGGRRGYGPTHSQSLEKHFIGMPGLTVLAANCFCDPGELLRHAVLGDDGPVLFVEHKLLYPRPVRLQRAGKLGDLHARQEGERYPTITLSFDPFHKADLTIVAYGYMAELAEQAAQQMLMEEEIFCEVVVPASISPLALAPVVRSLERSHALLVCEEGSETAGWGAEVIARVSSQAFALLGHAPRRVAARDVPIGSSRPLEAAILPQVEDIVSAAQALVAGARAGSR